MFPTEAAEVTCDGAQEKVHVELDGELSRYIAGEV